LRVRRQGCALRRGTVDAPDWCVPLWAHQCGAAARCDGTAVLRCRASRPRGSAGDAV